MLSAEPARPVPWVAVGWDGRAPLVLALLAREVHRPFWLMHSAEPGLLPWHAEGGDGHAPARVLAPLAVVHDVHRPLWSMLCKKLGPSPLVAVGW